MKIINKPILHQFSSKHPELSDYITIWLLNVAKANWHKKEDILITFPKAELLEWNRVRLPIIHSEHTIQADIHYSAKMIFIKFVESKQQQLSINDSKPCSLQETTYAY